MTEPRCEHTDMLINECAHCTGRTGKIDTTDRQLVATWFARFPGKCSWCEGSIIQGELMGKDEDNDYVCEKCISQLIK